MIKRTKQTLNLMAGVSVSYTSKRTSLHDMFFHNPTHYMFSIYQNLALKKGTF